jgi:hypothetical protein
MVLDLGMFLSTRNLCRVPGILVRTLDPSLVRILERIPAQGILRNILLLVRFLVQAPKVLFYRRQACSFSPPFFILLVSINIISISNNILHKK